MEPKTFDEAMKRDDAPFWKKATDKEIQSMYKNKTWELVDLPPGRKAIPLLWRLTYKYGSDGEVKDGKARLCVRGDKQKE